MIPVFYDLIDKKIQDDEIKCFVKEALNHAPKEFWTAPSSGTGKYHPPENQGKGGLIRHLCKTIIITEGLCIFFNMPRYDTDIILAGVSLHDIVKNGDPWGPSSHKEHGLVGARFLCQFELREPAKSEIIDCVRYHMSQYTGTKADVKRACNPTKKELIVQLADFYCSRQYASWLPGLKVREEDINNFFKNFNINS